MSDCTPLPTPSPAIGDAKFALLALVLLSGCLRAEIPTVPEPLIGHCTYRNNFSGEDECHEFRGAWTAETAAAQCARKQKELVAGQPCQVAESLGECLVDKEEGFTRVVFVGGDSTKCNSMRSGCEVFAGGYFQPSSLCGGDGGGTGLPVWRQPVKVCRAPLEGEPPGQGPDGQVCTWQMISGATEEGRHFDAYASCDAVRTQRPYYPAAQDPRATTDAADPRLDDPAYVGELDWLKGQVRAAACVCCHQSDAPSGPSNWYWDAPGNFLNGWHDRGLAIGAGWIDTVGFGAFPPEDNNGFSRSTPANPNAPALPTTDAARMASIFERELAHRGKTKADFVGAPPGAGPLDAQRFYRPTACEDGETIDRDGTIHWSYGEARYVYVLEAEASSPGVMPNLHIPEGTLWYLEVPDTASALVAGSVKYGQLPPGTRQGWPTTGAAPALVPGRSYYLYVLADVGLPSARCLFTAP